MSAESPSAALPHRSDEEGAFEPRIHLRSLLFKAGAMALVAPLAGMPASAHAQDAASAGAPPAKGWVDEDQKAWAAQCKDFDEWDKPSPPFRIYGNTYYVGTCGISAILIEGDAGLVLIDSGTRKGADLVAANIEKLGFALSDVKLLLTSHEHFDHVGGIAELRRRTGAKLLTSATAKPVLESGKASAEDPQHDIDDGFEPARVDDVVENGKPVRLGSLVLFPVATPGHTPGALSWQWPSCAEKTCVNIVYADSLSPISADGYRFSDHPEYVEAFRASLDRLSGLACTFVLTPHPSASEMRKRFAFGSPFGEPSCRAYARGIGEKLEKRLAEEAAQ